MRTSADHAEYDYHAGPPDEMEQAAQIAAELAALESEIGRAVIGCNIVHHALGQDQYESTLSQSYLQLCTERASLIARWRELHAEGLLQ